MVRRKRVQSSDNVTGFAAGEAMEDERAFSVGDAERWTQIAAPLAVPFHGTGAEVAASLRLPAKHFGYCRGVELHRADGSMGFLVGASKHGRGVRQIGRSPEAAPVFLRVALCNGVLEVHGFPAGIGGGEGEALRDKDCAEVERLSADMGGANGEGDGARLCKRRASRFGVLDQRGEIGDRGFSAIALYAGSIGEGRPANAGLDRIEPEGLPALSPGVSRLKLHPRRGDVEDGKRRILWRRSYWNSSVR